MRAITILKLVAVTALAASAVTGLLTATAPITGLRFEGLALSCLVIGLHATVALALLAAAAHGRARRLMQLGVIVAAGSAVAWLVVTWRPAPPARAHDLLFAGAATAGGWVVVLAAVGIALSQPANRALARWTRRATVTLAAGLLALWPAFVWVHESNVPPSDMLGRLVAVVAVLAVSGLVLNVVLARLHTLREAGDTDADASLIVVCPRCRREQRIRLNGDACAHCGLHLKVEIP